MHLSGIEPPEYPPSVPHLIPESIVSATAHGPTYILVVEDEEKMRLSVAEGLAMEGCEVSTAADGTEAIAMLDRRNFHLVVLDWMLPGKKGLDVVRHLRMRGDHTPVLMLTVRDSVDDRVIGLETGADDYLTKPFAFAELVARARALLRRPLPHAVICCDATTCSWIRARVWCDAREQKLC